MMSHGERPYELAPHGELYATFAGWYSVTFMTARNILKYLYFWSEHQTGLATSPLSSFDHGRCPLWVKSRHMQRNRRCPLYPQQRPRKRTSTNTMSALPPKAGVCGASADVGYGPKADSCIAKKARILSEAVLS